MEVDYTDEYLQTLATAWHNKLCRYSHIDQCGWQYCAWSDDRKYNDKHRWMEKVVGALEHAKDCGMTLQQFVDYERLGSYIEDD